MEIKLKQSKYSKIELGLRKIARNTGEDEDPNIFLLLENKIRVIKEEIDFFSCRHKIFYIIEPYKENKYKEIKKAMYKAIPNIQTKDYLGVFIKNGLKYMKYPLLVQKWKVASSIFEDLKFEHNIKNEDFTEDEWIEIQNSDAWKKTENQVAREIIAFELCKFFNLSS